MKAYKKILIPLDGSDVSEAILHEIERFAAAFKADISLLRVVHTNTIPGYVSSFTYLDREELQTGVIREAEEYLRGIENRLKTKGFKVESHVRDGDEAGEILEYCSENNIDIIAMSTHGRSGIGRWLLGSVAEKIVRHATKPIFLVRSPG